MNGSTRSKVAASCLILAGGMGRRLSPDKPLLEIGGTPIIARTAEVVCGVFAEVLVVTNSPEKYGFLGLPLLTDERQGCGPLMGIYSGLKRTSCDVTFVCAADMPFLDAEIIERQFGELDHFDIVAPSRQGRPELLHAFYRKRCLPVIKETLDADLFRIGQMARRCRTLFLDEDWFARQGLSKRLERAFVNINTAADYRRWSDQAQAEPCAGQGEGLPEPGNAPGQGPLDSLTPQVLEEIRRALVDQESLYQRKSADKPISSLWSHSTRVGRIAHRLALAEGCQAEAALLAGLLHDIGKFAHGNYHEQDIPEEHNAVAFVESILAGTAYERWIPQVVEAILTMYLEPKATSELGRVVYDADSLDKLGCLGVAQFFTKNALRRRFLDDDLMSRISIEMTYAHHAQDTLKTPTGRFLARERNRRTRRFYTELLDEWDQLGLGAFRIIEEEIAGIACLLVAPRACLCGGSLAIDAIVKDVLACRSVIVRYQCDQCGKLSRYFFCLPNVRGLPQRRFKG